MTKINSVVIGVLVYFSSFAQTNDSLNINFKVNFNKSPLELNKEYCTSNKDTVAITTFKCYISNIEVQYVDKTIFKEIKSYHLLDFENPNSFQIPITKKNDKLISKVTFNIGIDSLTNTAGALSGDLDPIKGMYWAWQSGYINMKIEGKSPSCHTRKNEFQFHVGGYLPPYYAMRKVELINDKKATEINIGIDLNNFFSTIKLGETNSVVIPGIPAMQLADCSKNLFYIE